MERQPVLRGLQLKLIGRHSGAHSEILIYGSQTNHCRKPICVKRFISHTNEAAERELRREFESLQMARHCLGPVLGETIPEPITYLPATRALVTGRISGTKLNRLLHLRANRLTGLFCVAELGGVLQRVGKWLRSFHDATRQSPQPFSADTYLIAITRRAEFCRVAGISWSTLDEILRLATAAARMLNGCTTPTAARHGDFVPQNILVDASGGIALVDFENFGPCEIVYQDLGMLLAYLLLLERSRLYSRRVLRRLRISFLDGYGGDIDHELLALFTVGGAVTIVSDFRLGARGDLRRRGGLRLLERRLLTVGRSLLSGRDLGEEL